MFCLTSSNDSLNITHSTVLTISSKPDKREEKKGGLLQVVQAKKDKLGHGLYLGDLT